MKGKKWIILAVLGVVLVIVLSLAFVFRQELVLRVTGMRPFVEDRFPGWVSRGATEEELDTALKRIYDPVGDGPGSWVYELSKPAAQHELVAMKAEVAGDTETAFREYKTAAMFYYIARFPFVSSPAKQAAYEKHIECYLKAARSFDPPLEVVRIPFEGKEIIGYLRIPHGEKPPVVLVTGGVDGWKSDIDFVIEPLLAEGLAVFAIDIPGTGQSAWALGPDSDRVNRHALEYLKTRDDIDSQNMGVYGVSYGGWFAVKLALSEPMIKAAVNVGGPVAIAYTPENIKKVPDVMVLTISHAMKVDMGGKTIEEIAQSVEPMSLEKQGFLINPDHRASLLSINGDQDNMVPIEDLYIISKRGIVQDELVYKGDGHCAPHNQKDWTVKAATWLKNKLYP